MLRVIAISIVAITIFSVAPTASAQPFSNTTYANLYSWQLGTSGQPLNPQTYLWDRYYYNNPNVSPYLNLNRVQPYGGTDYFTYVLPQEKLRQQEAAMSAGGPTRGGQFTAGPGGANLNVSSGAMMKMPSWYSRGSSGASDEIMPYNPDAPSRTQSYYYNHYYGGWQGRN